MRILIAEDDAVLGHMIATLLSRREIPFRVVKDGEGAVAAWKEGGFDIILMDLQMPHVDGIDATKLIREEEAARGGHVTIIAMTAHALEKDREECLRAGMDDYVTKPIDFDEFIALLERHGLKEEEGG
ncbi:response regulator [Geomonas sp. RF6]|uniref:response regulator n=1 Tax=Geomonas sp. RF6 TaxID=2897342 RepID=UPI001E2A32F0|nr:response regulator [Geomonas sp. RF6]UFS69305.1 response regulator [Geomonas sp. RF6]